MIIPLIGNIDLLLFTQLAVGKAKGEEIVYLPCRALAIAKKDGWMYGITIWSDTGGCYDGEKQENE